MSVYARSTQHCHFQVFQLSNAWGKVITAQWEGGICVSTVIHREVLTTL